MLKVEGVKYNVERHQEIHKGHSQHKVENILHFIFFQTWDIGKHGRKYIQDVVKAQKNYF